MTSIEQDIRRADLKFWLDGVRFWALMLEAPASQETADKAIAGLARCHQNVTDHLDCLIDERRLHEAIS